MKKLLAILLSLVMVLSLFAACNGETDNTDPQESSANTEASTSGTEATEAPVVEAEALPDAYVHLTFDGEDEGYSALVQTDDVGSNTGATYGLAAADVTFAYTDGAVDQCIYLDGTYGLDLGFDATGTDAYTVSFWVNAARLASYGPTLQIGHNIGMADNSGNDVTWMNVTQTEFSVKYFPTIWSRNEASDTADGVTDCWPWMSDFAVEESVYGKKEWAMFTIVCTGETQASPLGTTTVGAQLYINGTLVYDSAANYSYGTYFEYTWDATLAPNIMQTHDNFEAYFGINYWDTVFKGFVDDLYVYDVALTAGQVQTLWQMGDATVESVAPAVDNTEVETDPTTSTVEITPDSSAIATIGTTDLDLGWWSSFSDSYELAEGATLTIKLNNYSSGLNNYHNYVMGFTNTATTSDLIPSADNYAGYAEYAVVRADAYGWGDASYAGTYTCSWGDDWASWLALMTDAEVTITVTRNGSEITLTETFIGADGTEMTETGTVTTSLTADAPCYLFFTGEGAYIEILSVE